MNMQDRLTRAQLELATIEMEHQQINHDYQEAQKQWQQRFDSIMLRKTHKEGAIKEIERFLAEETAGKEAEEKAQVADSEAPQPIKTIHADKRAGA